MLSAANSEISGRASGAFCPWSIGIIRPMIGSCPHRGGADAFHAQRTRRGRQRNDENCQPAGRRDPIAAGPGHLAGGPVPDLPRQHRRQRHLGGGAVEPAHGREPAAVGDRRLRPRVRRLHAHGRHARGPVRAQEGDARRRDRLLCGLPDRGAGGELRHADRRPGGHGARGRRVRARGRCR